VSKPGVLTYASNGMPRFICSGRVVKK